MVGGTLTLRLVVAIACVQCVSPFNIRRQARGIEDLQKAWETEIQAGQGENSQNVKSLRVSTEHYGSAFQMDTKYHRGTVVFANGTAHDEPDEDTPAVPQKSGAAANDIKKTNADNKWQPSNPIQQSRPKIFDKKPEVNSEENIQGDSTSNKGDTKHEVEGSKVGDLMNHPTDSQVDTLGGVVVPATTSHDQIQEHVGGLMDNTAHPSSETSHSSTVDTLGGVVVPATTSHDQIQEHVGGLMDNTAHPSSETSHSSTEKHNKKKKIGDEADSSDEEQKKDKEESESEHGKDGKDNENKHKKDKSNDNKPEGHKEEEKVQEIDGHKEKDHEKNGHDGDKEEKKKHKKKKKMGDEADSSDDEQKKDKEEEKKKKKKKRKPEEGGEHRQKAKIIITRGPDGKRIARRVTKKEKDG